MPRGEPWRNMRIASPMIPDELQAIIATISALTARSITTKSVNISTMAVAITATDETAS